MSDQPLASHTTIDQSGQTVYGNQTNIATSIHLPHLDPADRRNQYRHTFLRQAVHRFWIEDFLDSSLHNAGLIHLGLDFQPNVVANRPWDFALYQPGQPERTIATDKPIVELFDDMDQQLLILGEPGSGKTTTLLALADGLLTRAAADPAMPTPVVFNLSSWAEKQPKLGDWLVEELNTRYQIPRKVAQTWVANDELLLLLDGLDEVAEEKRAACVEAINTFLKGHIVALAICSRTVEYTALTTRLKLAGAVIIRPLTRNQIEDYITHSGPHVATLRDILANNPDLRALAQFPFFLNIMSIAYREPATTGAMHYNTVGTPYQRIFDSYIQRMLHHREQPYLYPPHQTLRYLRWLSGTLRTHNLSQFSLYDLKLSWLTTQNPTLCLAMPLIRALDRVIQLVPSPSLTDNYALLFPIGRLHWQWQALRHDLKSSFETSFYLTRSLAKVSAPMLIMLFALFGIIGLFVHDVKWQALLILIAAPVYGLLTTIIFGAMVFALLFLPLAIIGLAGGVTTSERAIHKRLRNITIFSWPTALWVGSRTICFTLAIQIMSVMIVFSSEWMKAGMNSGQMNSPSPVLWQFIVVLSLMSGLICAILAGFYNYAIHLLTRWLLALNKDIPFDYSQFLDFCNSHIFLRRIGNSYMFVHRLLLEHFAALTEEDITRITTGVKSG